MNSLKKPFLFDFIGKIRDPIHDNIPYTAPEKFIINSYAFQRLRRIHQTAFTRYVFPGATHTRFEHSLGTMHIAGLLYQSLIENQKRILHSFDTGNLEPTYLLKTRDALDLLASSTYLPQCLRFAALLHDCGHPPLSHSGERFMPSWQELGEALTKWNLPPWLNQALTRKIKHSTSKILYHEIYTLLIVQRLFQEMDLMLSPQMGQDICAILDPSIPPAPHSELAKSGLQSLFHDAVSGEIDADRMDYLIRDSKECGVVYGYFDLGRILESLAFYCDETSRTFHFALRKGGISAYDDYLRARFSMYHQIYFHKTVTSCEAMLEHLKRLCPEAVLPLEIDDYLKWDDYNVPLFFMTIQNDNANKVQQLVNDLFYARKLWKRVYEESTFSDPHDTASSEQSTLAWLDARQIDKEIIETKATLTQLSPQKQSSKFKILAKHTNGKYALKDLAPYKDKDDNILMIKRIYGAIK